MLHAYALHAAELRYFLVVNNSCSRLELRWAIGNGRLAIGRGGYRFALFSIISFNIVEQNING